MTLYAMNLFSVDTRYIMQVTVPTIFHDNENVMKCPDSFIECIYPDSFIEWQSFMTMKLSWNAQILS